MADTGMSAIRATARERLRNMRTWRTMVLLVIVLVAGWGHCTQAREP